MLWINEGFLLDDAGNLITTSYIDLRDKDIRTVIPVVRPLQLSRFLTSFRLLVIFFHTSFSTRLTSGPSFPASRISLVIM